MLRHVRDTDIEHSEPITPADLQQGFAGLRRRVRDPRTLLPLSQRLL